LNAKRNFAARWLSSMAAIGCNAALQFAGFILLARSLGPLEFSAVIATGAAASIAAEFVGFGSGDLLVRAVSRDQGAFARAFGHTVKLGVIAILPVSLAFLAVVGFFFGASHAPWTLFLLIVAEVLFLRSAATAELAAIAHHRTYVANVYRVASAAFRLALIAAACLIVGVDRAESWAVWYAVGVVLFIAATWAHLVTRFGRPDFAGMPKSWSAGFLFSAMQVVRAAQFALDKFAVGVVASTATVGIYGTASRIALFGGMPASAMTRITYPVFFERGAAGIGEALRYALKLAPASLAVSLLSCAGLALISFLIEPMLGPSYADAQAYLLMLALLPLASAAQNVAGDILTGADHQGHRVAAACLGLALTGILTSLGAFHAGVAGAIAGYIAGHFLTALCLAASVVRLRRFEKRVADAKH